MELKLYIRIAFWVLFNDWKFKVCAVCPDPELFDITEIDVCKDSSGFGEVVFLSSRNVVSNGWIECTCDVSLYGTTSLLSQYYGPGYTGCGLQIRVENLTYTCYDSITSIDMQSKFQIVFTREATLNDPIACLLLQTVPDDLISVRCHKSNQYSSTSTPRRTSAMTVSLSATTSASTESSPSDLTETSSYSPQSSSDNSSPQKLSYTPSMTLSAKTSSTTPTNNKTLTILSLSLSSLTTSKPVTSTLHSTSPKPRSTSSETTYYTNMPSSTSMTKTHEPETTIKTMSGVSKTTVKDSTSASSLFSFTETTPLHSPSTSTKLSSTFSTPLSSSTFTTTIKPSSRFIPSSTSLTKLTTTSSHSSFSTIFSVTSVKPMKTSTSRTFQSTTGGHISTTRPMSKLSDSTVSFPAPVTSESRPAASATQDRVHDRLDTVIIVSSTVGGILLIAIVAGISVLVYRYRGCVTKTTDPPMAPIYIDAYGQNKTTAVDSPIFEQLIKQDDMGRSKGLYVIHKDRTHPASYQEPIVPRLDLSSLRHAEIEKRRGHNTGHILIYPPIRSGHPQFSGRPLAQVPRSLFHSQIIANTFSTNASNEVHEQLSSQSLERTRVYKTQHHHPTQDIKAFSQVLGPSGNNPARTSKQSQPEPEIYTIVRRQNKPQLVSDNIGSTMASFKGYDRVNEDNITTSKSTY